MKKTEHFSKSYTSKVKIKDFNVSIDGKSFFDVPVKNKEEAYKKFFEISKSGYYATGILMDYEYLSKRYKLVPIDLSKQIELGNPNLNQKISFIGKLANDKTTTSFIIEKS